MLTSVKPTILCQELHTKRPIFFAVWSLAVNTCLKRLSSSICQPSAAACEDCCFSCTVPCHVRQVRMTACPAAVVQPSSNYVRHTITLNEQRTEASSQLLEGQACHFSVEHINRCESKCTKKKWTGQHFVTTILQWFPVRSFTLH